MNILQINKFYHPVVGGVETVVRDYSEYFMKGGHAVTVLCAQQKFSWRTEVETVDGVRVYRCSSFGTFFSMPLSTSFFFYYIFLSFKADALIFHLPFPLGAMLSCCTTKKKIVVVWHSDILKQKKLKLLFEPFVRWLLRRSDRVVATSPQLIEFSDSLWRVKHKTVVIPLAVDVRKLADSSEAELEIASDCGVDFLFLGRLAYYKGIGCLLAAIKLLADEGIRPKIVIAGNGALSDEVAALIADNQLGHVQFINRFVTEEEKRYLFRRSKCFLFPSVTNAEAFGITQLEAMSFSLPVINTRLKTAVPWVSVNGTSGVTVTPGSAKELAEAMKRMLFNPELARSYGQAGFARVCDLFDRAKVEKHVIGLIEV